MANDGIRIEIQKLKEEKNKSIMLDKNDIIERHMKIAFADMTDFVDWGNENNRNIVKFKDSNIVDGGLICQIKQGKDGTSIKLEDRQKSLDWLSKYFEMNPMDLHKKEFDNKKLELEKSKLEKEKDDNNGVIIIRDSIQRTDKYDD